MGMASTMLIALWVFNETSWDKTHENYDSIYHVMSNRNFNGEIKTGEDMMYPLAKAAKTNLPEVQNAAIVSFPGSVLLTVGEKQLNKSFLNISPDFFDIFTYEVSNGSINEAVKDPDAIILTESTAQALFGNNDVIGQAVKINNERSAIVKAVIKDPPLNSTLTFESLIPFNSSSEYIKRSESDWVNCGNRVFFKTQENVDVASLEKKVQNLIIDKTKSDNPTTMGSTLLHPMSKWRLYGDFSNGVNIGGRIEYVNLFKWIAVIILIIACVNFMNLSTARSEKRAKEVGIRKTLGSARKALLLQFLAESMLLSFIAFFFAVLIVLITRNAFSSLLNEEILIPFDKPIMWVILTGIILLTGLLAGSYPALYISSFNPVKVLKGTFLPGKQAMLPRKMLVISQFIVSIVLISATLTIYQQLQYVKNRDRGYNQDNLVMIKSSKDTQSNFDAFRNDLLRSGTVVSVNKTSGPVTNIFMSTSGIRWKGAPENLNLVIGFIFTGADLAKTLQVKILEGRDFQMGDTNNVIFNKEAIKLMGMKNPVGSDITWAGKTRKIVGIVDNMVMTSPYAEAEPLMFSYENNWSGQTNVRLNPDRDIRESLSTIGLIYKKYSPEYPFEYQFVDEDFNRKFANEELIGTLSVIFAGLAVFICCLGLFGLISSSIERRKKEIGVRRVLGASINSLLFLMSKEFLVLVGIAFMIAIPVAWWAMNNWLQSYSYRIDIGISLFLLVGAAILLISFITVGLNASRAALATPVKSLRSE